MNSPRCCGGLGPVIPTVGQLSGHGGDSTTDSVPPRQCARMMFFDLVKACYPLLVANDDPTYWLGKAGTSHRHLMAGPLRRAKPLLIIPHRRLHILMPE